MLNLAGPFEFAPANHSLQELKSEGGPAEGGPGTSRKPESIRPVGLAAYAQLDICSELQLIDYSYPSKYLARPPPAVVLLPDVAMAGTFANAKGGADCHVAGLKMTYFEAMVLPSRVGGGKDLPGGAKVQGALGAGSKQTEGAAKPLVKPLVGGKEGRGRVAQAGGANIVAFGDVGWGGDVHDTVALEALALTKKRGKAESPKPNARATEAVPIVISNDQYKNKYVAGALEKAAKSLVNNSVSMQIFVCVGVGGSRCLGDPGIHCSDGASICAITFDGLRSVSNRMETSGGAAGTSRDAQQHDIGPGFLHQVTPTPRSRALATRGWGRGPSAISGPGCGSRRGSQWPKCVPVQGFVVRYRRCGTDAIQRRRFLCFV